MGRRGGGGAAGERLWWREEEMLGEGEGERMKEGESCHFPVVQVGACYSAE